jgi:YegS/Rv2252/BmrU family lipid kinase
MPGRRAVFVVNPASDGGGTGRKWPEIAATARGQGIEVVERLTESAGHATALAREAVAAGEELVVAVGGDGTVNEVVNGFFDETGASLNGGAALGVIGRGTGCDFVRTFDIPKRTDRAVATIAAGRRRRIDVGRATCEGPSGPELRMFANIASCGMSGAVAARANATSKRLGGTPAFLWATVATFAGWRNVEFHVVADGVERTLVANNVVCANCRFFGGGMKIAPDASPDDGLLDVILIGDISKADFVLNLHRLYRGTLGRHKKVEHLRARHVRITPVRTLPAEIDGEQPGTTPVTFEAVPGALDLIVP